MIETELCEIFETDLQFAPDHAKHVSAAVLAGLRDRLGGSEIYLPAPDKKLRDQMIRQMWNGHNMPEVCNEFEVSPRTVYRVISQK